MRVDVGLSGEVVAAPAIQAGAEGELVLDLDLGGDSVDAVEATLHGLAGARLALDGGRAVLRPGVRRRVVGTLRIPAGLAPGRYDLVVELRCQIDVDQVVLVPFSVDVVAGIGPLVRIEQVRRRNDQGRCRVVVTNPGDETARVALTAWGRQLRFKFDPPVLEVPAHGEATARLAVRSGGRRGRFVVTAATASTTSSASATLRGRRSGARALVGLAVVLGVLAGLGPPTTGLARATNASALVDVLSPQAELSATEQFEAACARNPNCVAAAPVDTLPGGPGEVTPVLPPGESGLDPALFPGAAAPPTGDPAAPPPTALVPDVVVAGTEACTTGAAGARIRGRALVGAGAAPASVVIRALRDQYEALATSPTNPDGTFAVCGLRAGDYLVAAVAEGYVTVVWPAQVGRDQAVDVGTIRMQPGAATLVGDVTGPAGPVAGALVRFVVDGIEVGWARTDDAGEYELIGLATPADGILSVAAIGFAPSQRAVSLHIDDRVRERPFTLVYSG